MAVSVTAFDVPPDAVVLRYRWAIIVVLGVLLIIYWGDKLPAWAITPPEAWTSSLPLPYFEATEGFWPSLSFIPSNVADWLNAIVLSFRKHEIFGLFTIRDVTRAIGNQIVGPLKFSESLLISGFRDWGLPPVPWVVSAALAGVLGWYLKGWKLALLSTSCIAYFAVFGKWKLAMTTLSLVLVTAPIAFVIGLGLGILAVKRPRLETVLWPFLNLMQSLPHFGYLIPIVVFVGLGHKAGAVATILFAFPPMAKLALVGLRGVSSEVLEAGVMAGCTPRQMLWKVRIPAARPTIMVGVNQVIMQCLAMVVIAAFVGAKGLGIDLLLRLQSLQLGNAMESGIAIVLMAVTLDRLSQAASVKEPVHKPEGSFWVRRPFATVAIAVFVAGCVLAYLFPWMGKLPKDMTISIAPFLDAMIKGAVAALYDPLSFIREYFPPYVLVPLRDFFKGLPWTVVFGVFVFLGWRLGGWRMAALMAFYIGFIVLSSWWTPAMVTAYLVFTAVVLCILFGFPLGVWASRRESTTRFVAFLCDTFQTFPSFIYLIPVIMLFQVGNISQVMAIVVYASIPIIRYTYIGLRAVPRELVEAAITSGCTRRQILWKVRMPLAFPEIMLGLNQTIMFGLFMVMIAGFIGGNYDLAREIFKAKANNDAGLGLLLALCVAFMGLAIDRLLHAWANQRKQQLGVG
jgi:glycine betaine/proline transport system permease protein